MKGTGSKSYQQTVSRRTFLSTGMGSLSIYHHLGIDPHVTPITPAGRSKPLLEKGEVIRELQ